MIQIRIRSLEGASYSMQVHPDAALDQYADSLIALIANGPGTGWIPLYHPHHRSGASSFMVGH